MNVAKITAAKADEIRGQEIFGHWYFEPIQDINGNWIVSMHEATHLPINDFEVIEWVAPEMGKEII
ncbi:MAG: hypothetical protein ITG00_00155 [Flavobacterium sp.]|nr:hypothetical protein [Flavobacterium sp.]